MHPTHRATSCAPCQKIADQLNEAADRYAEARNRNDPDQSVFLQQMQSLARALDACEEQCLQPQPVPGAVGPMPPPKERPSPPLPPPPPPIGLRTSWSGLYGSGYVTGSFSSVTTTEELAETGTVTHKFDDCCSGVGGGFNLGYDWLLPNEIVFGGVADAYFPNDRVNHPFGGGTFLRSTNDFTATFQARAGILAMPDLLLYAQTGLAVGNQNLKINFGGPVSRHNDTTIGPTLGVGAEWRLYDGPTALIGRSPSLFLEYSHTWWDDAHFNTPAASPAFNYTFSRESNVIKGGLRIRF